MLADLHQEVQFLSCPAAVGFGMMEDRLDAALHDVFGCCCSLCGVCYKSMFWELSKFWHMISSSIAFDRSWLYSHSQCICGLQGFTHTTFIG